MSATIAHHGEFVFKNKWYVTCSTCRTFWLHDHDRAHVHGENDGKEAPLDTSCGCRLHQAARISSGRIP